MSGLTSKLIAEIAQVAQYDGATPEQVRDWLAAGPQGATATHGILADGAYLQRIRDFLPEPAETDADGGLNDSTPAPTSYLEGFPSPLRRSHLCGLLVDDRPPR